MIAGLMALNALAIDIMLPALPDMGTELGVADPNHRQYAELVDSIRQGEPLNEGRRVAESTMTAIMGRMSAYAGRALQWKWAMEASKLDLGPPKMEFGDLPEPPVAIPGQTKLI